VQQAQARWRERLEAEPIQFFLRELEDALDAVRARLAAFVGCPADELAFVANATTGVNTIVRSWDLKPGDEVLITDHGYNACNNAAGFDVTRAGARLVVAKVPFPLLSADQVTRAVLAAVTPKTRFALIDHVTSPTGLVFPIEAIVEGLHARGVEVLVDGAHAPGMLPVDLKAIGADWYTGNLHKWVCAPKVAGFLHVPRAGQESVRPLVISHAASSTRTDRSRFLQEFDWMGTFDPSPVLCVPDALDAVASTEPGGWSEVRRKNHDLALEGRGLITAALGVDAPAPVEMIGSLAAVPLPADGSSPFALPSRGRFDPLQERLWERHKIEVPVMGWPAGKGRLIRISAQRYNRRADYEKLAAALRGSMEK
jgi:isopenicillin-N epimerase